MRLSAGIIIIGIVAINAHQEGEPARSSVPDGQVQTERVEQDLQLQDGKTEIQNRRFGGNYSICKYNGFEIIW